MEDNDEVRAYKILMERHLNDDRLINERMSVFLLASSFLFAGFVFLINVEHTSYLRIIVPVIGIILCILVFMLSWRTTQGLCFWEDGEKKIEEYGYIFKYMREARGQNITPHQVYNHLRYRAKCGWLLGRSWIRTRYIYTYCIPALFLILWIPSLIWAAYHYC